MLKTLSQSEIKFIEEGIAQNFRIDGRGRFDFRPFVLETGVVSQTNGSARLRLDTTDILVGIKAELGEPHPDFLDKGDVRVSVECNPSSDLDSKYIEKLNVEIAGVIERLLKSPSALNLSSFCLVPKRIVWIFYVDILVLDYGGNLFDAVSIATRAALSTTTIPKVNVIERENEDFELDLTNETIRISGENIPICVTMNRINGFEIIDATFQEELCYGTRVTFAIDKKENFCTIQKGYGSIGMDSIISSLNIVKNVGKKILETMDELLQLEKEQKKPKLGFFA